MLKCFECKNEISILARSCPHCGSKQQFKGYVFKRAEVKAMGVHKVSDFYNFENCGGKIKAMTKWDWLGLGISAFILILVLVSKN